MASASAKSLLQRIGRLLAAHGARAWSDQELLIRFVDQRDEAAFAAMMERHGRLVLGLCRRILRNEADAEDAFQATFLILAQKAGAIRRREALGCWLHQVAYHAPSASRSPPPGSAKGRAARPNASRVILWMTSACGSCGSCLTRSCCVCPRSTGRPCCCATSKA